MKAPTSLFDRPGRAAAVVGGVVAVSATAAVALVTGTATATPTDDESGRCTKNVNVRAEPDVTSRIVGLCEQGTEVQVGESRDGFLQLTNLGGWAAQEYVSVNGSAPAPAGSSEGQPDHDGHDGGHDDDDNGDDDGRHGGHDDDDNDDDNGDDGRHNGHNGGDDDDGRGGHGGDDNDDDGDDNGGHNGHNGGDDDDGGHSEGGETGVRIG
jgi:hypothetical protein